MKRIGFRVLLGAEIFAFLVMLANAFSGLRFGPQLKGDKLSKVIPLDPKLALPKRVQVIDPPNSGTNRFYRLGVTKN